MERSRLSSPWYLADLTWPEAKDVLQADTIVLLPVGAIEAHGPHLPLDTDVVIAIEAARRGAVRLAEIGESAVIAPPIVYGTSYVGACFPGTTPVPAEVVTASIVSILSALMEWGPRRACIVNAHLEPAHVAAIKRGVDTLTRETDLLVVFPDKREDRWASLLSDEFVQGMRHAGAYETSLMLATATDRVRKDLVPTLLPLLVDLPAQLRAGAKSFFEAGGTEGYFGNPAIASAEEGERLFDALAHMILTAIHELDPDGPPQ